MWTTTAISHIFINNYHTLIISLFLRMLYIRATGFVKNVVSCGNWLFFEVWYPLTTWKHGKTSHLKLLLNIHSWKSEVEVLWLNLPLRFIGAVCHKLATHNSTWCLAIQVVLTLLPTIYNSNPHWPHDPNRMRTYYSPPHLSSQVQWSFAEFTNNQQAPARVSHARFFIFTTARLSYLTHTLQK
jgi:hypothetical protein